MNETPLLERRYPQFKNKSVNFASMQKKLGIFSHVSNSSFKVLILDSI